MSSHKMFTLSIISATFLVDTAELQVAKCCTSLHEVEWKLEINKACIDNFPSPRVDLPVAGIGELAKLTYAKEHVLCTPLPGTSETKYHLRPRHHKLTLSVRIRNVTERDFVARFLVL